MYSREGLEQEVDKVPSSEHEVVLERSDVVHEHELVKEHLEQSPTRNLVRRIDRPFESGDVAVLEHWNGSEVGQLTKGRMRIRWRSMTDLGPRSLA